MVVGATSLQLNARPVDPLSLFPELEDPRHRFGFEGAGRSLIAKPCSCSNVTMLLAKHSRCMLATRGSSARLRRVPRPRAAPESGLDLQAEIGRARKLLDEIIDEATQELFVEETTAEALGEACEFDMGNALQGAVRKRAESLDSVFMNTLSSYIMVVEREGPRQILEILLQVREFAVEAVRESMPPELKWVDTLVRVAEPVERRKLLTFALEKADGAGIDLVAMAQTAGQLIDDMETRPEVGDRKLLVRLCSVRELARDLCTSEVKPVQFPEAQVPRHEASFIKELMSVGGANLKERRQALLSRAFGSDWSGAGGISEQNIRPSRGMVKRGSWEKHEEPDERMKVTVRPGRFMDCLDVFIKQNAGSSDSKRTERLEAIRGEAIAVLEMLSE